MHSQAIRTERHELHARQGARRRVRARAARIHITAADVGGYLALAAFGLVAAASAIGWFAGIDSWAFWKP